MHYFSQKHKFELQVSLQLCTRFYDRLSKQETVSRRNVNSNTYQSLRLGMKMLLP